MATPAGYAWDALVRTQAERDDLKAKLARLEQQADRMAREIDELRGHPTFRQFGLPQSYHGGEGAA